VNQLIACCGILRQILARTDMAVAQSILPTKVVGIGLNKTGTKTLGACLRHWGSDHISCSREGFDLWTAANREALMHIVERHQSFDDWPWPLVYREIDRRFPGTKFVLTRRTTPEAWFSSLCKHAGRTGPTVFRKEIYGYEMPYGHQEAHIAFYNNHLKQVRAYFAGRPDDLLEVCWEAGDGWKELASFLGQPVPALPFPHLNKARRMPRPACYSTSLRYVFIHIPKCAGTSIHRALGALHERLSLPIDEKRYHKHTKAIDVRRILGPVWDDSFKFSIVRNPWDLMVSSYYWWLNYAGRYPSLAEQSTRIRKMGSFAEFLQSEFGSQMINERRGDDLLDWIEADKKVIIDFVGRYETLESDWRRICQKIGVEPVVLTTENRVPRAAYATFYDNASRRLVGERFHRTIKLFGYEF
jgi:Sulfotransferase domain/Sulfotransferase family